MFKPKCPIFLRKRDLFEIPEDMTYLNCAALSPQMRAVSAAGLDSVKAKAA